MNKNRLLTSSLTTNVVLTGILVTGIAIWPTNHREATTPFPAPAPPAQIDESPDLVSATSAPVESPPSIKPAPKDSEATQLRAAGTFSELLAELEELDLKIVPNRFVDRIRIPALDSDARLTDDIRDLFALGDQESERLNEILALTAESLRHIELENMQVTSLSDTEALIQIAPLGPEADHLRDGLRDGILHEMGDIDGPLLWEMIRASGNGEFWSGFGESGAEITLTLEPNESGHLGMSLERKPYDNEHPRSTVTLHPFPPEDAPENLQLYLKRQVYLIDYLPEDMRGVIRSQAEGPR